MVTKSHIFFCQAFTSFTFSTLLMNPIMKSDMYIYALVFKSPLHSLMHHVGCAWKHYDIQISGFEDFGAYWVVIL